jgi:hypothetical protein
MMVREYCTTSYDIMLINLLRFQIYFVAEVLLLDTEVVVFKSGVDCKFYISGLVEEVKHFFSHIILQQLNIFSLFDRMNSS